MKNQDSKEHNSNFFIQQILSQINFQASHHSLYQKRILFFETIVLFSVLLREKTSQENSKTITKKQVKPIVQKHQIFQPRLLKLKKGKYFSNREKKFFLETICFVSLFCDRANELSGQLQ